MDNFVTHVLMLKVIHSFVRSVGRSVVHSLTHSLIYLFILFIYFSDYPDICTILTDMDQQNWGFGVMRNLSREIKGMFAAQNISATHCPFAPGRIHVDDYAIHLPKMPSGLGLLSSLAAVSWHHLRVPKHTWITPRNYFTWRQLTVKIVFFSWESRSFVSLMHVGCNSSIARLLEWHIKKKVQTRGKHFYCCHYTTAIAASAVTTTFAAVAASTATTTY